MPIGQATSQPVNVPQGPLVTPATPVGADAVNAMVDAFRKGQIQASELVDRFGMAARAKTQLDTSQAEAALPLVEPTAQLQQAKMASELAQTNWGQTSLKTAQETMGWYGDSLENYRLPNGQTDFQKLAKVGAQRMAELGQVDAWAQGLKKESTREITLKNGRKKPQFFNARGEDITPPDGVHDGSPKYWYYVDQMSQYLPVAHPLAKQYPTKYIAGLTPYPGEEHARGEPGATPLVSSQDKTAILKEPGPFIDRTQIPGIGQDFPRAENPKLSAMRAALVTPDASNAREVSQMTPEQVLSASPVQEVVSAAASALVSPSAPTTRPVVSPAATSGGLLPYPLSTDQLSAQSTIYTAKDIREELMKEEPYQSWQKTLPFSTTFEKNANRVRNLSPEQQSQLNLNMVDLGLAESLIKLYDPAGVIREFKWEKFETNQPRMDLLKNAWSIAVKRTGSFTPDTRAELIKMGDEVIEGREEAARPAILKAIEQAKSNPEVNPKTIFTSEDERVAAEKAVQKTSTAAKSPLNFSQQSPGAGWIRVTHPKYGEGWQKGLSFTPIRS